VSFIYMQESIGCFETKAGGLSN